MVTLIQLQTVNGEWSQDNIQTLDKEEKIGFPHQ